MKTFTKQQVRALQLLKHATLKAQLNGRKTHANAFLHPDVKVKAVAGSVIDALDREGMIVFGSGASYVRLSAKGQRLMSHSDDVCRRCGCTDSQACEGGCRWVEPDLCSGCVERKAA